MRLGNDRIPAQIYDYLTTFGDEVTFVWKRPKGMGTVLYVLNRYPAFVDLTSTLYSELCSITSAL